MYLLTTSSILADQTRLTEGPASSPGLAGSPTAKGLRMACGSFVVCDESFSDTVNDGPAPYPACVRIRREESARKRSLKSGRCWRATRSVRNPPCGKIRYYSPMPSRTSCEANGSQSDKLLANKPSLREPQGWSQRFKTTSVRAYPDR